MKNLVFDRKKRGERVGLMKTSLSDSDGIDTGCTAFWRKKVVWTLMFPIDTDEVSQVALVVTNAPASAGNRRDVGSIPGSGRSPGEGNDNPLQYSCLENPHGQRSLAGYSPWGCKESDMTEST